MKALLKYFIVIYILLIVIKMFVNNTKANNRLLPPGKFLQYYLASIWLIITCALNRA